MEVNVYNLFKEKGLVNDYKEYNDLVRLRCMYVNEKRIDAPVKKLKVGEVKSIRAGFNQRISRFREF